jgi:hypothetical protein
MPPAIILEHRTQRCTAGHRCLPAVNYELPGIASARQSRGHSQKTTHVRAGSQRHDLDLSKSIQPSERVTQSLCSHTAQLVAGGLSMHLEYRRELQPILPCSLSASRSRHSAIAESRGSRVMLVFDLFRLVPISDSLFRQNRNTPQATA